ncbi:hypothetical protein GNP92_14465 [Paenibacillus timonensis]|nr:hypothetical protein [Paenibacillus timonensis]
MDALLDQSCGWCERDQFRSHQDSHRCGFPDTMGEAAVYGLVPDETPG